MTVTLWPPVAALLVRTAFEATSVLYVNDNVCVSIRTASVMSTESPVDVPIGVRATTHVSAFHSVTTARVTPTRTVCVISDSTSDEPTSVMLAVPVAGAFVAPGRARATGKLYDEASVTAPERPASEAVCVIELPVPVDVLMKTAESLTHTVTPLDDSPIRTRGDAPGISAPEPTKVTLIDPVDATLVALTLLA